LKFKKSAEYPGLENLVLAAIAFETTEYVRTKYGQNLMYNQQSAIGLGGNRGAKASQMTEIVRRDDRVKIPQFEQRLTNMISRNVLERIMMLDRKQEKNIPPRVLIVDDEPDITEVLKMGLELKGGFQVDIFNDPQDALLHFRPGFYDLLLSDIKMPHLNGFELYSKIRDIDKKIRVCFITAYHIYYYEFRELFPKLDAKCFANKPISIERLIVLIREELSLSNLKYSVDSVKNSSSRASSCTFSVQNMDILLF